MIVGLVDDAAVNLKVYETILARIAGVTSRSFTSSEQALKWCATEEPDLLIIDYKMPKPNGLEFIAEYKVLRAGSDTSIVMITGERDRAIRHKALELGASDFLNKPADPVEFLARVRNLLALRDSRKKLANKATWLANEVQRATAEIAHREEDTIIRLMRAAEFRDNETGMHIQRMGHYAAALGEAIGLAPDMQRQLQLATPMHDIGKVAIPDSILLKPASLTPPEWDIMRTHTTAGYEILKDSKSKILQLAAQIALSHHERYDGSGYPNGVAGDIIPLPARICAISDVFDALTSVRPYKQAWSVSEAMAEIRAQAGEHFDPRLVAAFERIREKIEAIRLRFADDLPVAS